MLRSLNFERQGKLIFEFYWCDNFNLELVKLDDAPLFYIQKDYEKQIKFKREMIKLNDEASCKGKVLVSRVEETVVDGASEIQSRGLVDLYDLPPIDTWFYLSKVNNILQLYAWIPDKFIPEANEAIAVNCVDLLYWLEGEDLLTRVTL